VDTHAATPGAIRYSTIPSFKGLEAEVVFLIDADTDDSRFNRSTRYVAVSRATHALHIYQSGRGWAPFSNQ
jgi:DNA helicase IV